MGGKSEKPLLVKGKRLDGRKEDEMRSISIKAGVIKQANGSCEFKIGETTAIAAVYGPKKVLPKHLTKQDRAILDIKYDMIPFSTSERCRPGPGRRSKEISKVVTEALTPAILLKEYPATAIEVFVQITNANAGTRTAAINAAAVALIDAGIEMKDTVASIAAGKIEGKVVLDLFQDEDNFGEADLPIAVMPNSENITLLQMDGHLTKKELKKAIEMCKKGCKEIAKKQRKAIKKEYMKEREVKE